MVTGTDFKDCSAVVPGREFIDDAAPTSLVG